MIGVTLALALMVGEGLWLAALVVLQMRPPGAVETEGRDRSAGAEGASAALVSETGIDGTDAQRQMLARAGFSHPAAPAAFAAVKLLSGIAASVVTLALILEVPMLSQQFGNEAIGVAAGTFVLGYLTPSMIVRRRVERYNQRIEKAVPDALDLMQICVEAGQSLDLSFRRISRELAGVHAELAAHFSWASQAIAAGLDRNTALLRIAQATGNDDLRLLASTVSQSVRLGTPIVPSLRAFSEDLRDRRVRRIETRVNVLPTKMTLGTMLFTLPPLLMLLLTPALLRITSIL